MVQELNHEKGSNVVLGGSSIDDIIIIIPEYLDNIMFNDMCNSFRYGAKTVDISNFER